MRKVRFRAPRDRVLAREEALHLRWPRMCYTRDAASDSHRVPSVQQSRVPGDCARKAMFKQLDTAILYLALRITILVFTFQVSDGALRVLRRTIAPKPL